LDKIAVGAKLKRALTGELGNVRLKLGVEIPAASEYSGGGISNGCTSSERWLTRLGEEGVISVERGHGGGIASPHRLCQTQPHTIELRAQRTGILTSRAVASSTTSRE